VIPLVLVHGFMGGSAQWNYQRSELSKAFDIVAIDLPGFGENADLPVINSIEGFAEWVMEDLSAKGVKRYNLLGHSMGGMIAQEMARRDATRVERLVLYATGAIGVLPGRFETIAQSKAKALSEGAPATARRIAATWFLQREAACGFEACAAIAGKSSLAAILAGLDAMQAWSGETSLGDVTSDTLIIWGDRDRTYSWAQINQLWQSIPKTSLAVMPGCAHAVHLEKPEAFNGILIDFLDS